MGVGPMEISEAANTIPTSNSTLDSPRTVILLVGAVDLESTECLDREFAQATWIGTGQVTLDMSQLQLIDEPAVSSVLRGITTLRAAGAALEIRYPSPMALQLFEMCTPLQLLGIEFTSDPQEHLSDEAFNWTAREVVDTRPAFGRSHALSSLRDNEDGRVGDDLGRSPQSAPKQETGSS